MKKSIQKLKKFGDFKITFDKEYKNVVPYSLNHLKLLNLK